MEGIGLVVVILLECIPSPPSEASRPSLSIYTKVLVYRILFEMLILWVDM